LPPTWYWRGGVAVEVGFVPPAPYVFCGNRDVFSPVVATRVVTGAQVPVVGAYTVPFVRATPAVASSGGSFPETTPVPAACAPGKAGRAPATAADTAAMPSLAG